MSTVAVNSQLHQEILLTRAQLGFRPRLSSAWHMHMLVLNVETDKGDVPIQKEYFQLWYMQGTPYALYDNYAYVTL
jgi:hypothetical protein